MTPNSTARTWNKLLKDTAVELGEEFDKNFEHKAFFKQKWTPRRREDKGSLLVRSGKLRSSIRKEVSDNSIRFTSSLPYAAIHNEGGDIVVTKKMKKYFWFKYHEAIGKVKTTKRGELSKSKSNLRLNATTQFYKAMALAKEGSKIHIPQRQFIGDATEVRQIVEKHFQEYFQSIELVVKNILKPKK